MIYIVKVSEADEDGKPRERTLLKTANEAEALQRAQATGGKLIRVPTER